MTQLSMPYFHMRCRMIQLGYIEAKGVMHFVAHKHIRPFAFDPDSLRAEELTFLITPTKIRNLCKESEEFRALINSNRYVYAEGHLVYNDPKFVSRYGKIYVLTDLAIANVDICCLRFVRVYVQKNLGQYVLGRMYMDAEYVERTMFYLGDALKQPNLNNFRAKRAYIDSFPTVFKEAVDLLKSQNKGVSNAAIAEALHISNNIGNSHSDTLNILPMTRHMKKPELPCHAALDPDRISDAQQMLDTSMILAEQITTIGKYALKNYVGHINDSKLLNAINTAVAVQLGLSDERSIAKCL